MIYFLFIMFTPFCTHPSSLEVALCSHHACFTVLGLVTGMCQWVELCQRLRKPSHVSLYEQSYQFQCRAQEWTPADLNSLLSTVHNMFHPFLKVYAHHTYFRALCHFSTDWCFTFKNSKKQPYHRDVYNLLEVLFIHR